MPDRIMLNIYKVEVGTDVGYVTSIQKTTKKDINNNFIPLEMHKGIKGKRDQIIQNIEWYFECLHGKLNSDCSREILNEFEDNNPPIEIMQRHIGGLIAESLNINDLFYRLFKDQSLKDIGNLVITTNDFRIPWEWAYFRAPGKEKGEMLCEIYKIGKLYPENILKPKDFFSDDLKILEEREGRKPMSNPRDEAKVLVIYDDCKECCLRDDEQAHVPHLKHTNDEAMGILEQFRKNKFDIKKNITLINGQDDKSRLDGSFAKYAGTDVNLNIFHFSGHISDEGELICKDGKLKPSDLWHIAITHQLFWDSLVFFNGCLSGKIKDAYDKLAQFATAFTSIGAKACLMAMYPVREDKMLEFSQVFYEKLLAEENWTATIGDVLWQARIAYSKRFGDYHIEPFLYTLFGYPDFKVLPIKISGLAGDEEVDETVQTAFDEWNNAPNQRSIQ